MTHGPRRVDDQGRAPRQRIHASHATEHRTLKDRLEIRRVDRGSDESERKHPPEMCSFDRLDNGRSSHSSLIHIAKVAKQRQAAKAKTKTAKV